MRSLLASLAALNVLLPVVAARRGGGGGIDDDTLSLRTKTVYVYGIFAFVTLIQLLMTLPHLFRSGLRVPAAGIVVALVIMVVGYALGAGAEAAVSAYRKETFGDVTISYESSIDLGTAAGIFFDWGDPAMFVAVAIILHNRFRTVQKKASAATIGVTSIASVLVVLMIALVAAKQGIDAATLKAELHGTISFTQATDRITTANNCFYAFVALHIVSTIFLAVSAFLVKARTENDRVVATLFVFIPLLLMHALARFIFVIVEARLLNPESNSFDPETQDAIDCMSFFIPGLLNATVMGGLVFLIRWSPLWNTEPLSAQDTTQSQPHTDVQGVPQAAQFPRQWVYPQQQQGLYPQRYASVPALLPQNTAMLDPMRLPQSEKVQTSPQTSSRPSPRPSLAPLSHTTDHEPV